MPDSAKSPAVFLDRDGVINRALVRDGKPYPPAGLEEFEILPGVVEAYAKHVFHLYCVESSFRDALMQYLKDRKIGCGSEVSSWGGDYFQRLRAESHGFLAGVQ